MACELKIKFSNENGEIEEVLLPLSSAITVEEGQDIKSLLSQVNEDDLAPLIERIQKVNRKLDYNSLELNNVEGLIGNTNFNDLAAMADHEDNKDNEELKIVKKLINNLPESQKGKFKVLLVNGDETSSKLTYSGGKDFVIADVSKFKTYTDYSSLIHELIHYKLGNLADNENFIQDAKTLIPSYTSLEDLFVSLIDSHNKEKNIREISQFFDKYLGYNNIPNLIKYGINTIGYSNKFKLREIDVTVKTELYNLALNKNIKDRFENFSDKENRNIYYFPQQETKLPDVVRTLEAGDLILVKNDKVEEYKIVKSVFQGKTGLNISYLKNEKDGIVDTGTVNLKNIITKGIKFRRFNKDSFQFSEEVSVISEKIDDSDYLTINPGILNTKVFNLNTISILSKGDTLFYKDDGKSVKGIVLKLVTSGIMVQTPTGNIKTISYKDVNQFRINPENLNEIPNDNLKNFKKIERISPSFIKGGDIISISGKNFPIIGTLGLNIYYFDNNQVQVEDYGSKKSSIYKKLDLSKNNIEFLKEFKEIHSKPLKVNFPGISYVNTSIDSNFNIRKHNELQIGDLVFSNKSQFGIIKDINYEGDLLVNTENGIFSISRSEVLALGLKNRVEISPVYENTKRGNERLILTQLEVNDFKVRNDSENFIHQPLQAYAKPNGEITAIPSSDNILLKGFFVIDKMTASQQKRDGIIKGDLVKNIDYGVWNKYTINKLDFSKNNKLNLFTRNGLIKLTHYDEKGEAHYLDAAIIDEIVKDPINSGIQITYVNRNSQGELSTNTIFVKEEDLVKYDKSQKYKNKFAFNGYYVWYNYSIGNSNAKKYIKNTLNQIPDSKLSDYLKFNQDKLLYVLSEQIKNTLEVDVQVLTSEQITELGVKGNPKGFVSEGVIYLNKDSLNAKTLLHEVMHIFLADLKVKNKKQYDKLIQKAKKSELFETTFKEVDEAYVGLSEDKNEEVFVKLLSSMLYNKLETIPNLEKTDITELRKSIENIFETEFKGSDLEVINMELQDVSLYYGKNLFGKFNKEEFVSQLDRFQEISLSAMRNYLVEEGILSEICK